MWRVWVMFWLLAGEAAAHGMLDEQLAELNRAIAQRPGEATLHLKRGELHRKHRDWQAALADFDAARRLDPSAVEVELGQARLAMDRGAWGDARESLGRYLAARPNSEVGHALRARVHEQMDSHAAAAAADYANAIRHSSEPRVEYFLGQARAWAAAGDHEAGLAAADAGLARLGPLPVLEQWAIAMLVQARRWDGALTRLDRLIAAAPRKETTLTQRADILALAGRAADSRAAFEAARVHWDKLPERIRATQAMIDLRQRIDTGLASAHAAARTP
jgi:tetratricopeptide (TPR) repeat protein